MTRLIGALACAAWIVSAGVAWGEPLQAPAAREVARGVYVLPGAVPVDRGLDGNTVILSGRAGLVVVDTGRHAWHSDAILAFAAAQRRPIVAIVNTHWHLDHTSGNRRITAVFPQARLYTTAAIDRALAPGGFLERGLAGARAQLADPNTSALDREEIEGFLATMDASASLRPDVVLERSRRLRLAGRRLDVRITAGAVSDADVWIYDRGSKVAIVGDLVTFPSPFFESACPNAWRAALDEVWATPFEIAIPGHGEPMSRAQFDAYRSAFNAFLDCVGGEAEASACATGWVDDVAQFLDSDAAREEARQYAAYYVGFLRQNGGKSPDCLTR
ncbi:MAG: MBL fold metallo-hydrolase [Hyphomonadaceae bacterium]|nr:MBL fold metallo-hydrolase [Hyphomonadaceae bacterium]